MKSLSLADMHCDTPFELFCRSQSLEKNKLSVSLEKANSYLSYIQAAAVWSDKRLDDDAAYAKSIDVINYFTSDVKNNYDTSFFIDNQNTKVKFVLSIEDARILGGDIRRLHRLYDKGVRIITPLWSGSTCIGGAFDTNLGLTPFGKGVVMASAELGIIPDISHASEKSADDIFEICDAKTPVIASHSSSYSVCPHKRNLKDEQFKFVKRSGGVVGISLCINHLGFDNFHSATDQVISHIEHYLSVDGEDTVCFGCDFDGAETPPEFSDISSLLAIADKMSSLNYSDSLIEKIFHFNAENFIKKNIK